MFTFHHDLVYSVCKLPGIKEQLSFIIFLYAVILPLNQLGNILNYPHAALFPNTTIHIDRIFKLQRELNTIRVLDSHER